MVLNMKREGATIVFLARDEADHIGNVVKIGMQAKKEGLVKEVIVVDDHSKDKTAKIAKQNGALVVPAGENPYKVHGKGGAFLRGLEECRKLNVEFMIIADADLVNFKTSHISGLVKGISGLNCKMLVAECHEIKGKFLQATGHLSGERALRVDAFDFLFVKGIEGKPTKPASRFLQKIKGYGLENALNDTIGYKNTRCFSPREFIVSAPAFRKGLGVQKRDVEKTVALIEKRQKSLKQALKKRRKRLARRK